MSFDISLENPPMRPASNPTLSLIPAGMLLLSALAAGAAEPPLEIGSRKQLFIDEPFVAEQRDVALVVNPPGDRPSE